MTIFWVVLIVFFLILEAATVGLTSIWFVLGSAGALLACQLGAPIWLQIVWFLLISIAALIATRPLVRKYVNTKSQPTNADRVIGMQCRVTERIDALAGTGAVYCDGKTWSARTADGSVIEPGTAVRVCEIRGVTLYVMPCSAP